MRLAALERRPVVRLGSEDTPGLNTADLGPAAQTAHDPERCPV
jgi:hypothetical protein